MEQVVLAAQTDFAGWRAAARRLAAGKVPPADVVWQVGDETADLFAATPPDLPTQAAPTAAVPAGDAGFRVPRAFLDLAEDVIQAREPARFSLLYQLLWRLAEGERHLLEQAVDPQVHRFQALAKAVRYAAHKMRAFVRFREIEIDGVATYVAWFEPEHYIVEANASFFVRRFTGMSWSILTPDRSVAWDGKALAFGPGATRSAAPDGDAPTPASPRQGRVTVPAARQAPSVRAHAGTPLADVAERAAACRACPLWEPATQTVFGEGPADAPIMLIGEQPGDQEDLAGRPFVGPAGQILDKALAEAGLDRGRLYLTNAVKHFKFEPRGKRRIHAKPGAGEISACVGWLDRERTIVKPALLVLLGATAVRAVLRREVSVLRERGRFMALEDGTEALVTVHPSYLLRLPDLDQKAVQYAAFVTDLKQAATRLSAA